MYVISIQIPINATMFGNNIGGKQVLLPLGNLSSESDARAKAAEIAERYAQKIDQRPTLEYKVEKR